MAIIIPDPVGRDAVVTPDPPGALGTNRRLTKAFIDVRPVTLTLTPRTKGKKPAGGWAWVEGTPRDPQVFTIIEQTGLSGTPRPQVTADGVDREVEFYLLGEWDAQISRGDVFTHQGKEWEVVDLYLDNGYETRVVVSARG